MLVPLKAFRHAKSRLGPTLDTDARAGFARRAADTVLAAAHDLPVTVVCDDDEVATFAADRSAAVLWRPGRGLDGSVQDGVTHLASLGHDLVIVAHGDLPLATDLRPLAEGHEGVTLVPDRHGDGTNVAVVPATAGFRFAYGPGSFARHRAEARRIGAPLRIVDDDALAWDVDRPADLDHPDLDHPDLDQPDLDGPDLDGPDLDGPDPPDVRPA